MDCALENVEKEKIKLIPKEEKPLFIKIEEVEGRKIYHTKIMMDLYTFKTKDNRKHKFFIAFRGLFNQNKIEYFHLFSIREGDKFLGIRYGYRKPIKNILTKYQENGITKSYIFSKAYYIEFKFKKGSVFCYLRRLAYLLRKDVTHKQYYKALINMLIELEKQVYEFYGKKLSEGGLITKWIEKNLK
ncbi:Putative cytosolic protein (plasmid) [Borrelia nietonii YOR]|uniref:Putative cytosolic protein n=2 Tax=Borrelia TaxID=138 RepID=W5SCX3_9SPIR|nr:MULTISPECIES: DUF226 domain-containing protein [Borrelia]AHH04508.1 Putative cytosolic protein [Borrelia nietonii YOR]AHH14412.1 Putative cytosolic protein [Borrelia hermsii MTW]UPA10196.1 DUF226 domain-containing protein [Borrelia nietonii YOR]